MPDTPAYVWTVDDISQPDPDAFYNWSLNTSPDNDIRLHKTRASIRGGRFGHWLDVHVVLPRPHGGPTPPRPDYSAGEAQYGAWRYLGPPDRVRELLPMSSDFIVHRSALFRPRLTARVPGVHGRFMAIMLPRMKGARPPRVRSLPAIAESQAVRITFDNVEDTLIFAHDHRLLEADDIVGRGHWCIVRRSRSNARVLHHAIHDGEFLSVGKRRLLDF